MKFNTYFKYEEFLLAGIKNIFDGNYDLAIKNFTKDIEFIQNQESNYEKYSANERLTMAYTNS